jgi:chaperonin GroEL (HSP60 family)
MDMSEEQKIVREDTPRGRVTAQKHNIGAAKAVADAVRTTLGPAGMDKMMLDPHGSVIVTNDGATILRELDTEHPGSIMIVDMAKTQESMCHDGTTTAVVLGGQLLSNSEQLFQKGLHPNVICRGYNQAAKWAVEHASGLPNGSTDLTLVAKTAMTGKSLEHSIEVAAELCVNAVIDAGGDIDRVRVICQPGGSVEESHLFPGVILHKEFALPFDESHSGALLVNTGLQPDKMDDKVSVNFQSADEAKQFFSDRNVGDLLERAQIIVKAMPTGGILFCRDGVAENVVKFLADNNIPIVNRVSESDMLTLSRLLEAPIHQTVDGESTMETGDAMSIRQETIGDMDYIVVEGPAGCPVSTLVLRGATRSTLDEYERAFEDALGVVSLAFRDGKVITGGGSCFISMAHNLRQRAAEVGGRAQMAVEAFAEALEVIPATIAENAGLDPLDTILALRNDHQNGKNDYGPDVTNGGTCSMGELGVFEPLSVVTQAVNSATEVAISILRIDDIMGSRGLG